MRVTIETGLPKLRIRSPKRQAGKPNRLQQRRHVVHQPVLIAAEPIPFEQGEFFLMQRAAFFVTVRMTDLIDIAAAGREQPLHRKFRGGLQEAQAAVTVRDLETAQCRIRAAEVRECRRLHFERTGRRKIRADRMQECAAPTERIPSRRRPPINSRRHRVQKTRTRVPLFFFRAGDVVAGAGIDFQQRAFFDEQRDLDHRTRF